MLVYRLSRKKYSDQLSGKGSAICGARWNSIGTELIYCADSRSLAMAEVAVHLTYGMIPNDFMMLTIDVPKELKSIKYTVRDLPRDWNIFPYKSSTQSVGDRFVSENKYPICFIPSVVVSGDWNILINPRHHHFEKINIVNKAPFIFDRRLFEK